MASCWIRASRRWAMEGSLSVSCSRDSRRASSSSEDGSGMMLGELGAAKGFALRPATSSIHCAEE